MKPSLFTMPTALNRFARLFASSPRRVEFANDGYLSGTAPTGNKAFLPDATIVNRYNLVIIGSAVNNCTPSAANTDIPLGICTDSPDPSNLDQPVNVALLGCTVGTTRVVLGGTVSQGDMLQSNGDGTAIKLLTTTGTFYGIGRAMMAGVTGDLIEIIPTFPWKVVNP